MKAIIAMILCFFTMFTSAPAATAADGTYAAQMTVVTIHDKLCEVDDGEDLWAYILEPGDDFHKGDRVLVVMDERGTPDFTHDDAIVSMVKVSHT